MNEQQEEVYLRGERQAWRHILQQCLMELGYHEAENLDAARLVKEREDAIARLRSLCDDFGDNDWQENLYLADIIDKHLGKHLHLYCEPIDAGEEDAAE